jgi:hypothetical protein
MKRQTCRRCFQTTSDYFTITTPPDPPRLTLYVNQAAADAATRPRHFHYCRENGCAVVRDGETFEGMTNGTGHDIPMGRFFAIMEDIEQEVTA